MKILAKMMAATSLLALSGLAYSDPVNVGGVVWDTALPTSGADQEFTGRVSFNQGFFNAGASWINPTSTVPGDELKAWGEFTSFNGNSIDPKSATGGSASSFCPGCELTFALNGLLVDPTISSTSKDGFNFSNATLDIYVDGVSPAGPTANYDNSLVPLDTAAAENGQLFLHLAVVDLGFSPIGGNGFANGALTLSLQALSGLAKSYFDTNSLGIFPMQFDLGSSASAQFALTDIDGVGGANDWVATATGQLKGDTAAIPEPSVIALFGLGLLGFNLGRRQQA